MHDRAHSLPTAPYVTLVVNLVLLATLAWHIVFEAVPQTLLEFHAARDVSQKLLSLVVLMPYATLIAFVLASWPRSAFRWRTAVLIFGAVAAYALAVVGMGPCIGRNFFPA